MCVSPQIESVPQASSSIWDFLICFLNELCVTKQQTLVIKSRILKASNQFLSAYQSLLKFYQEELGRNTESSF